MDVQTSEEELLSEEVQVQDQGLPPHFPLVEEEEGQIWLKD